MLSVICIQNLQCKYKQKDFGDCTNKLTMKYNENIWVSLITILSSFKIASFWKKENGMSSRIITIEVNNDKYNLDFIVFLSGERIYNMRSTCI